MELEKFKTKIIPLRKKLYNQAKSMLFDEDEAEDSVQEAYLRLWDIREQLVFQSNVEAYAMQVLKNICIDKIRKYKTKVTIDNTIIIEDVNDPYRYTEHNNAVQIIRKIIDSLPELQRRIILMRDVEGYELEEIATITGSEPTAVRMNLSRARKKVRDYYMELNKMIVKI